MHGWIRVYRPKSFISLWRRIDDLIDDGRLKASIEVLNELKRKDDDIYKWCRDRRSTLCVEIDDACQLEVGRLMQSHPRLVDTVTGKSAGDPFVIALASSSPLRMTVVTEEHPGKSRIPDVCAKEQIDCLGLAGLIEREGWQF
jgi:hypothetical protein